MDIKKEENNESRYVAKSDKGKLEISLVPTQIIRDIARVRMYGKEKYHAPNNWVLVEKQRYKDAMMRHLLAYLDDENSVDEESGIPHYMHAACNMAFLCEMARPNWEEIKQHLIDSDPLVQDQLDKMNKVDCSCLIQECDKPNKNGRIYDKEAVKSAMKDFCSSKDNDDKSKYRYCLNEASKPLVKSAMKDFCSSNEYNDDKFKTPGYYQMIFICNSIDVTNRALHNRLIRENANCGIGTKIEAHCADCTTIFELKEYFNDYKTSIWHRCSQYAFSED